VKKRVLLPVLLAQFFSSLADNALLTVAIALLISRGAPDWMTPALRVAFYASYVLLAAFAGAVSDAAPKGQVMLITNLVKLGGCGLLAWGVQPLLCYALVGLGAAGYGPAKYGILPELLLPEDLVAANGWIEATTVVSIVAGLALGGVLVETQSALPVIAAIFLASAIVTILIPRSHARNRAALANPRQLILCFVDALALLWHDRQARTSLAVTSLFWAAAAVLQFMVLRWAGERLGLPLSRAALLQLAVAIGMVAGAIGAARFVTLKRALRTLPLGLLLGALVTLMAFATDVTVAFALLLLIGALAGLLLVPMNAVLQSRGLLLMQPGQSIAAQNFYESLASLLMLGLYGLLVAMQLPLIGILVGFGALLIMASTCLIFAGADSSRAIC
jgi:LPLT family lysophospholipid transporter-like MFS transporter